MNVKTAINILADPTHDDYDTAVELLSQAIAEASERGEWYDEKGNSTHVEDWIRDGSFDGNETLDELVIEWDE